MIKINLENEEEILKNHVEKVQQYINYEALQNREKSFIKQNIEYILKAKPEEFEDVIFKIKQNNIDNNRLKKAFVGGKNNGGSIGYSKFSAKGTTTYNAYDLAQKLKVNVCSYCNRNYTFTIRNKSSKSTRPDFDHFYDKGTHPILALSFYNLIPSCILCNSRLKSTAKFSINTHLHPYKDSFNDYAKFKLKIINSMFFYDEKAFELKLVTTDIKAEKIKEFDDLFHNPTTKKIRQTASFYDEGVESGKKRVEMIQFVAKTKIRRDEKAYFEYEDSIGFIFSLMAQLTDEISQGEKIKIKGVPGYRIKIQKPSNIEKLWVCIQGRKQPM